MEGRSNCFGLRSPDTAKIKQKMLFASSRDTLRKSLSGIVTDISATDDDDVSYETSMFLLISQ